MSRRVVDAFFDLLPAKSSLPADRILFVVCGIRRDMYDPTTLAVARGSYFDQMRNYFMTAAQVRGHSVIDIESIFLADLENTAVVSSMRKIGTGTSGLTGWSRKPLRTSNFSTSMRRPSCRRQASDKIAKTHRRLGFWF